jgi:hypothetical protein
LNILGDEWARAVGNVQDDQGRGSKHKEQQRTQRDKSIVNNLSEDPHCRPSTTFAGSTSAIPASMQAKNAKSEPRKSSVRISVPQGMENMKGIFGESAVAAGHRGNIAGVSSEDCGQQELKNMHQLPNNFAQSSAIPHLSTANHKDSSIICLVDRLNFSANTMTSSSSPSSIKPSTSSCVGELLRLLPESSDVRSHARQAIIATNSEHYHIRNDDDDDDDDGGSVHLGGSDNRIVQKQQQHKQEQTYDGAAGGGLNFTYSSHGTRLHSFLSLVLDPYSKRLNSTRATPLIIPFKVACNTTSMEERGANQRCCGSS